MDLVKNNYYKSSGSGKFFDVHFDKFPKVYKNHYEESKIAAQIIHEQKQGNLYLMYSGGLDSEFALSSFLEAGINIKPVFVKLFPNYNYVDYNAAIEFCNSRNIQLITIDIDFDKFVDSGQIFSIAEEMECSIYHRSALAYAITKLDGTIICGDCEPYIKNYDRQWYLEVDENEFSLGKYYKKHGIYGTPYFGCYTAEKFISYLQLPRIHELINNLVPGKTSSFSSKSIIYNTDSNYNLKHRQKLHGYEEMEKMPIFQHEVFKQFDYLHEKFGGVRKLEIRSFIAEQI